LLEGRRGGEGGEGRVPDPLRVTLVVSAALLLSICAWCLVLLARSVDLRRDLDLRRGWIEEMRQVRLVLERPAETLDEAPGPQLDALRRASRRLAKDALANPAETPAVADAARRLGSSLDALQAALDARDVEDEASTERVWDASFAALTASTALEERIRSQVDGLYRRLDEHWRSLNRLLVVCLALCASNLGLLYLAYRRRGQIESARDRALELASHDPLTGLWNRDSILKMLRRELARAKRLRTPLGVVLADIDDFQQINGLIGQDHGDQVLQEVAWRVGSLVRPYDTLGRFGGDSFLALLPTCDEIATRSVGERLRRAVGDRDVEYSLGRLPVHLSVVVCAVDTSEDIDADLLIHRLQETLAALRRGGESGAFAALGDA
ncbi:MAG: diguanylate cyclase, partial [Acidobacteriota bacterium]